MQGGKQTAQLVSWVRQQIEPFAPNFPIIASGGKTAASIQQTIDAGANAITFTAYGMTEAVFQRKMELYRQQNIKKVHCTGFSQFNEPFIFT